jgi:predicted dehydrogenase
LRAECEHFLECIKTGKTPQSDGYSGLRIVSILEAANRSLRNGGSQQAIDGGSLFPNAKS